MENWLGLGEAFFLAAEAGVEEEGAEGDGELTEALGVGVLVTRRGRPGRRGRLGGGGAPARDRGSEVVVKIGPDEVLRRGPVGGDVNLTPGLEDFAPTETVIVWDLKDDILPPLRDKLTEQQQAYKFLMLNRLYKRVEALKQAAQPLAALHQRTIEKLGELAKE